MQAKAIQHCTSRTSQTGGQAGGRAKGAGGRAAGERARERAGGRASERARGRSGQRPDGRGGGRESERASGTELAAWSFESCYQIPSSGPEDPHSTHPEPVRNRSSEFEEKTRSCLTQTGASFSSNSNYMFLLGFQRFDHARLKIRVSL